MRTAIQVKGMVIDAGKIESISKVYKEVDMGDHRGAYKFVIRMDSGEDIDIRLSYHSADEIEGVVHRLDLARTDMIGQAWGDSIVLVETD